MNDWRRSLALTLGDVITLTGAGGKTTTLFKLGEELKSERVLLTTTTKMMRPQHHQVDYVYSQQELAHKRPRPKRGRTFVYGELIQEGKCSAVSEELLAKLALRYDYTIIEGDGSRGLPLKGYVEGEPCIPSFANVNVGIVTLQGLFSEARAEKVLRPAEFARMTGIQPGEKVRELHLARWISHPQGLFKGSSGRKILFFNQVQTMSDLAVVESVLARLPETFRREFERVVAGEVKKDNYVVVEEAADESTTNEERNYRC